MPKDGTANAKQLRKRMTDAEWRMWFVLRDRRLARFKFRRQVPISPWIVDFICIEVKVIVEVDGGQHGSVRDLARDADLARKGYRVVHYWNHDVLLNTDGVLNDLLAILEAEAARQSMRH
jgi:very-short-patch-repair endonuclease